MRQTPQHDWKPYKPATKRYRYNWNKPWPKLNTMYKGTRNSLNKSHDHQERSKPFKLWEPRLPYSDKTNRNQNTKFGNMPPETDTGDTHQRFTRCPSRICSSMTSKTNTTETRSWGTKWRKCSNKIHNWHKKFQRPMKHCLRHSKRTPSWLWSPRRWPPTCSSDTAMDQNETLERRISPHGESHFSKRSESESKSEKIMTDSKTKESESESKSESKKIMTDPKTKRTKQNVKVKANKVKAINRLKDKIRTRLKRQQDKIRKFQALKDSILKFSFHRHLTATFTISILFFNSVVLDHFDHHFVYPLQTFTSTNFKDCEKHFILQTKALHSAKTEKTNPAILESTRLHGNPETRPNILAKDLHRNTLVSVTLQLIGRLRTSGSNIQIYLIFYYHT
jgi:hypothetical protein